LSDFGFRGVEFGNWAASDERQHLVNFAYDALHDLADILCLPPQVLSLNGALGLALGARGGGRAAAHYEPSRRVINMTKVRGGGFLAHEFGHALDHYFGELDRPDAYQTQARWASGGAHRVVSSSCAHLRLEMHTAWARVRAALYERARTHAEVVKEAEDALAQRESAVQRAQDQLTEPSVTGNPQDDADREAWLRERLSDQTAALDRARTRLQSLRAEPAVVGSYGTVRTAYYRNAVALCGKSGSRGYWARTEELFARAFECYVFDQLRAREAQSQYLVQGVEAERFAGPEYRGNPYPAEDRAAINEAIGELVATWRLRRSEREMPVLY
jgi:hypothetical protein